MMILILTFMNLVLLQSYQCSKDGLLFDILNQPGIVTDVEEHITPEEETDVILSPNNMLYMIQDRKTQHLTSNSPENPYTWTADVLLPLSEKETDLGGILKRPGANEGLVQIPKGFSPSRGKRQHYRDVPYVDWLMKHLMTIRRNMHKSYQLDRIGGGVLSYTGSRGPKRSKFAPPSGFSVSRGK